MAKKLNENKKQIQLLEAANNQISENNLNLKEKIDTIVAKNDKLKKENDRLKLSVDKLKKRKDLSAGNSVATDNAKKFLTGDTTGVNTDLNRYFTIFSSLRFVELLSSLFLL